MKKRLQFSGFSGRAFPPCALRSALCAFLLFSLCAWLLAPCAFAANTVTISGNVITISTIDSDWSWSDDYPSSATLPIGGIIFVPGATDDVCVIKEGSAAGAELFEVRSADVYDQKGFSYGGAKLRPVLDVSAGTYSAGSKVVIIIHGN